MRQLFHAIITTVAAIGLVAMVAPPVLADPSVGWLEGMSYFGVADPSACEDDGQYRVFIDYGTSHEDNAFEFNAAVNFINTGVLSSGSLNLCGEMSRGPGGDLDGAIGTPCRVYGDAHEQAGSTGWAGGDRYFGHSGKGQLQYASSLFGGPQSVQIRNFTWAPSATGTFVAWGDYEGTPSATVPTKGTVLMHWGTGSYGKLTCLYDDPDVPGWGTNTLWGAFALVPTDA